VLSVCFNFVLEFTTREIVQKYATTGAEWPLRDLAGEFVRIYAGGLIPETPLAKLMQPLHRKLALPLREVLVASKTRRAYEHLLDSDGGRRCGLTTLRTYDSGKHPAQLNAWVIGVEEWLKGHPPACQEELLAHLFDGTLLPFAALTYVLRALLKKSYAEIAADYSAMTLGDLARRLACEPGLKPYGANPGFDRLKATLDRTLGEVLPNEPKNLRERHKSLLARAVGDTRLPDYAISNLERDIANWSWSIMRSVRRRYLR